MKRSAEMLRRGGEVVRNDNGFWPANHDVVKRKQVTMLWMLKRRKVIPASLVELDSNQRCLPSAMKPPTSGQIRLIHSPSLALSFYLKRSCVNVK